MTVGHHVWQCSHKLEVTWCESSKATSRRRAPKETGSVRREGIRQEHGAHALKRMAQAGP